MPKSIAGSCACEDFKALDKRKALQRLPQAYATKLRRKFWHQSPKCAAFKHKGADSPLLDATTANTRSLQGTIGQVGRLVTRGAGIEA